METTDVFSKVVLLILLSVLKTQAAPPVFNNIRSDECVGELENQNRLMKILDVTDPDGDTVTCSAQFGSNNNADNGNEFTLTFNAVSENYELDVAAGADFTTATYDQIYLVTIRCNDGGQTSTATVFISVEEGQDIGGDYVGGPVTTPPIDCLNTAAGATVYTATATNALNTADTATHNFEYQLISVTSSPSALPAGDFFDVDPSTGTIFALQDLKLISTDVSQVTVTIRAREDCLESYATIILDLDNQNTPPTTTALPLDQDMSELISPGTVLFTLNIIDPDAQTHTIDYSCNPPIPPTGNTILTLSGNNLVLAAGQSLDAETIPLFQCSFVINDGIHDSPTYSYTLNVLNGNDPPVFGTSKYYVRGNEGTGGTVLGTPGFTCTDDDVAYGPEPLTYTVQASAYSAYFSIDSSGVVSFAAEYNVDTALLPTEVTLDVNCCDDENACDTAQLIVTIIDANDNKPIVPVTVSMYSDNMMTPGVSIIGSLSPTDSDISAPNNQFTCNAVSSSLYAAYYHVTTTCDVILAKTIDFDYGATTQYTVYVVDKGSPQQTGTVVVDVVHREIATAATTTTIVTTTPYDFWTHPENIALTCLAALFCLALLAFLTACCIRYCWGRDMCCKIYNLLKRICRRRYHARPPTPITPPRTPTPPPREKSPILVRDPPPPTKIIRAVEQPVIVRVTRTMRPTLATNVPGMAPVPTVPPGPGAMIRPPVPYPT